MIEGDAFDAGINRDDVGGRFRCMPADFTGLWLVGDDAWSVRGCLLCTVDTDVRGTGAASDTAWSNRSNHQPATAPSMQSAAAMAMTDRNGVEPRASLNFTVPQL
jgi:hypothetical protein